MGEFGGTTSIQFGQILLCLYAVILSWFSYKVLSVKSSLFMLSTLCLP